VDTVASFFVTTTSMLSLGDSKKRLFFEQPLNSIIAQRCRIGLCGDFFVGVIDIRGTESLVIIRL
jgi:hypothetical protein